MLDRLKKYIDFKGVSVSAFEKSIGMSNASFGKSLKSGGTIGADKLEYILRQYPDLNILWLITGDGEMILKPSPNVNISNEPKEALNKVIEAQAETINILRKYTEVLEEKVRYLEEKEKPAESGQKRKAAG